MKNLKKLTRRDLKSLQGGGIGDCGAHFPEDPPMPGEPYTCPCNLYWCEAKGSCVHQNMMTPEYCELGL
jgi:hypothetical protein